MQVLDRKTAPSFKIVDKIKLVKAEDGKLDNGIPVYHIKAGQQDLVKIELIFNAGNWEEPKHAIALSTNDIINDGTFHHSREQIANVIDYHGAFLELNSGHDTASVSLYCLNKHLKNVLPIFLEIIKDAAFPDKEVALFKKRKKQQLNINNQKVDYVARKKFYEVIHGKDHPYGYYPSPRDFDRMKRDDLLSYHQKYYSNKNCTIVVSGKFSKHVINLINKTFGTDQWGKKTRISKSKHSISQVKKLNHLIKKDNIKQSGIRIGKLLFNRTHPDYPGLIFLNTVLGGYFGSRLMTNIREDKGYTYGIGSGLVSLRNSGYFFISTEVGVNTTIDTLREINYEIKRLRNDLVPSNEMELVRNYILGSFLSGINNPFALANKFKNIMLFGLGYDYYDRLFDTIRTISSEEIRELCNKYLDESTMYQIVVGNK